MYGPADYYLQNLATGQFERDPATPGGQIFDDLNAPSGSAPLCSPLRYPSVGDPHNERTRYLGSLTFYGRFALAASSPGPSPYEYHLRRCGSNLNQFISGGYDSDLGISPQPFASSRAVTYIQDGITLHGWYLPSLRRFTIRTALRDYVEPVALTKRTIYIRTRYYNQLWAATLPAPDHRR
jgi:hypothetical protein